MRDKTYTPGPQNDHIDREDLKTSGTVPFDLEDDGPYEGLDPRNLKRGQYVEITVRGYLGAIAEVGKSDGKKDITVREYAFKASSLRDLSIIAEPVARPNANGQLPGQMSVLDAGKIEKELRDSGIEATVEIVAPLKDDHADAGAATRDLIFTPDDYPRASLRVGSEGGTGELVVLAGDSDDVVTLDEAPLPAGPWILPQLNGALVTAGPRIGTVLGLIDKDTAAVAHDAIVYAIPTDHFLDGTITIGTVGDATPVEPGEVREDPPPTEEERLADDGAEDPADRAPLAPDADPSSVI